MTGKSGTFLVTNADGGSAVLSAVDDGQVHALSGNPGLDEGEVIEGTVAAEPPLEVTWTLVEVEVRYTPSIEASAEPPSERARALDADLAAGELAHEPTDGGELHVIKVGEGAEGAIEEVASDAATRARAARLGATRVEVRGGAGIVGVRYSW